MKSRTKTKARARRAAKKRAPRVVADGRIVAGHVPKRHHLDKRANLLVAAAVDGTDDDLLTEKEMAEWFHCSVQWLAIGRSRGYGPPYERLGPRLVRYHRSKVKAWLNERSHRGVAEYRE